MVVAVMEGQISVQALAAKVVLTFLLVLLLLCQGSRRSCVAVVAVCDSG